MQHQLGVKFGMEEFSEGPFLRAKFHLHWYRAGVWGSKKRNILAWSNGHTLNSSMPNFTPKLVLCVAPAGQKAQYRPPNNLSSASCFVLCAMLAAIRLPHHKNCMAC